MRCTILLPLLALSCRRSVAIRNPAATCARGFALPPLHEAADFVDLPADPSSAIPTIKTG